MAESPSYFGAPSPAPAEPVHDRPEDPLVVDLSSTQIADARLTADAGELELDPSQDDASAAIGSESHRDAPSANVWEPLVIDRPEAVFEPRSGIASPYRPDTVVDGFTWGRHITLRAASIRGYGHRYKGVPRQDDFAIGANGNYLFLAVADGVSAAPISHIGATVACRYAVDWCNARALDNNWDWEEFFKGAAWALVEYAARLAGEPVTPEVAEQMLASTLTVAVLSECGDAGGEANIVQMGDSDAWLFRDGKFHNLTRSAVRDAPIHSSAVSALPRVTTTANTTTLNLDPGDVILLGTDGFGDPLGDGDGLVGQQFTRYLETIPPMLAFAHALDFSRETFDDDRTLVSAWIGPPSNPLVR